MRSSTTSNASVYNFDTTLISDNKINLLENSNTKNFPPDNWENIVEDKIVEGFGVSSAKNIRRCLDIETRHFAAATSNNENNEKRFD